eukprot:g18568.t1
MRRGRYLDGVEVDRLRPLCRGSAQRWDVLVTAPVPSMGLPLPHGAHHKAKPSTSKAISVARTVREQCFLEETITALRKGGSVLIPADVAGWISEALLLFEAAWGQDRQLSSYPICWLSSVGDMVLDQVKTRLEYMGQEVLEAFESKIGHHPFVLKNIRIFQSLEELIASHPLNRPKDGAALCIDVELQCQASEPAPPPEFTVAMKAEDILSVKGEDPKVKEEGKTEVKSEVKAELKIKEERKDCVGDSWLSFS